ncbi:MAG: DUF4345 family protein [Pseudomonadota bacterium]
MVGYLWFNGVIFLIIGIRCLVSPVEAVAIPYSMQADSKDARNYLRASAGGVTITSGVLLMVGGFSTQYTFAALMLAITLFAGLVFGRIVSLFADGKPSVIPFIAGSLELLGLLFGIFWFAQIH